MNIRQKVDTIISVMLTISMIILIAYTFVLEHQIIVLEEKIWAEEYYTQYIEEQLSECRAELERLQIFYSDIQCPKE